ncbi:DUF262 domain-containing protein [Streptomyces sp. NPDC096310]|uniref:DUF262 domain-containing protein n=1 Tax=Streptomyces sp. NPDC096310 TaxID=3366082 RepID=UPI00381CB755
MTKAGLETQPSGATYELDDLLQEAWSGQIRVPHFQRDFRWNSRDVTHLFDSILRGYPIGSLLLWVRHSPAELITLGSLEIEAKESDRTLWVVDGQQRIISLANSLHPEGNRHSPFNVYYNLAKGEFLAAPKIVESHLVPLHVLFDLEALLGWFADAGKGASEYLAEASRVSKRLRQYKIPAYLVKQDDEAVLRDIFDRVNNFGKRLSRAEIFSALFPGADSASDERLSINKIAQRVASRTGFGTLDEDTVLRSILARRGPDITREFHHEFDGVRRKHPEFSDEGQEVAFNETEAALVRAIEFFQNAAGVPHLTLLSYRALMIVFTRFFAHFPNPEARNIQLLRRLYWRVSVSGPAVFKGSFTQMSKALTMKIHPGDENGSVKRLMASMSEAIQTVPNPGRFRTNEATGKIVLCSWWALRPRSPITGLPYDIQDLADILADETTAALAVQRIFRSGISSGQQLMAANRLFVPRADEPLDDIQTLLVRRPLKFNENEWSAVLASHCMSFESVEFISSGDRDSFLSLRQNRVTEELGSFLARMAEWEYEDTPALDTLDLDDESGETGGLSDGID